jgi:hypothetical protein
MWLTGTFTVVVAILCLLMCIGDFESDKTFTHKNHPFLLLKWSVIVFLITLVAAFFANFNLK